MEELKYVHLIGAEPMPYMVKVKDPETEKSRMELGTLGTPFHITSNLEYDRFLGELYRNMPSPSMLNQFLRGLEQRDIANEAQKEGIAKPIIETYLGEAGAGKTFMAELAGRLVHEKGAILVDCGAKNLKELLFETVIDNPKAQSLFEKIDTLLERYNAGIDKKKLEPSIVALREALGEAFSEQDGHIGIDWTVAAQKRILAKPEAQSSLDFVAKANGLERVDTSVLGLKSQEGPLIRAWKEGRPIILDEYNKNVPDSENALQGVLSVFIGGEKTRHTVSGEGLSFTFDRADRKPGFFVTITGNRSNDGTSTNVLSGSAYSRIDPTIVGEPTQLDWEHRICQILTGVPMSSMWRSQETIWKALRDEAKEKNQKDPFADFCRQVRTAGLTEEEKRRIPRSQLDLIDNYPVVLEAASQLAEFYIGWSEAVIPDDRRPLGKEKSHGDEVTDEYSKENALTLRKVIKHINTALSPLLKGSTNSPVVFSGHFGAPIKVPSRQRYEPLEELGSNLMQIIDENVENATQTMPSLREYLTTMMINLGIQENPNKNVKKGGIKTLAELLNIHIERPEEKYKEYAALICEDLRTRYPDLAGQPDEQLIQPAAFEMVFQDGQAYQEHEDEILMPNTLSLEEFSEKPLEVFKAIPIDEDTPIDSGASINLSQLLIAMTFPNGDKIFKQKPAEPKVVAEAKKDGGFLGTFAKHSAVPTLIETLGKNSKKGQDDEDQGQGPAQLHSCVMETTDGNALLVQNKKTKEAIVIGSGQVSEDLKQSLKKLGIYYLSQSTPDMELNETFKRVVGSQSAEFLAYMTEEFGLDEEVMNKNFSSLIKAMKPDSLTPSIQFQKQNVVFQRKGR